MHVCRSPACRLTIDNMLHAHMQMYVAIPLLPLVYPFIWFNTNAIGVARVLGLYDSLLETPHYKSSTYGIHVLPAKA